MRRLQVLVVVACCSTVAVVQAGDDAKELKKLAGKWTVVSAEKSGKKAPDGELDNLQVVIAGNKLSFKKGDKGEDIPFKIDPSKKPKQIDLTTPKGETVTGIYEVTADMLKICASAPGEARPTAFASPEGGKIMLLVLKRAKE
jgi:uncharacterized protein (TIGR03067 family)